MIENAPDTAYFKNAGIAKTIHKVAVSQENIYYVKFLSAYGTEANMKTLFYLDFLCERIKVKNADGSVEIGYWGGVYDDPNGFNYQHHNSNKLSRKGLRVKDAGGAVKDIIILNDPLNTRAHAALSSINSYFANYIESVGNFFSAYYGATNSYGFEYKRPSDSTWTEQAISGSPLAQQQSGQKTKVVFTDYPAGTVLQVRPYIINAQGKYSSQTYTTITLQDPVFSHAATPRTTACGSDGTSVNVWMRDDEFQRLSEVTTASTVRSIRGHSNPKNTVYMAAGWYYGLNPAQPTRSYEIGANGEILRYQVCTPPVAYVVYISASEDGSGRFTVNVTLASAQSGSVTVTGRLDVSTSSTVNGDDFSITLAAGQTQKVSGLDFLLTRQEGFSYQFINISVSPTLLYQATNPN